MAKEEIIIHGNLCDLINYKAFIENQASELAFLDYPKEYKVKETVNITSVLLEICSN